MKGMKLLIKKQPKTEIYSLLFNKYL